MEKEFIYLTKNFGLPSPGQRESLKVLSKRTTESGLSPITYTPQEQGGWAVAGRPGEGETKGVKVMREGHRLQKGRQD